MRKSIIFAIFFYYTYLNLCFSFEIIFNEYHQPAWLTKDTGFCGYSDVVCILREKGFKVSNSTLPLNRTIKTISKNSLLILGISKFQKYSNEEILSIKNFVEKGGNILVLGEHEDVYKSSSNFQNKVLQPFGLSFENNIIINNDNDWIEIISPEKPQLKPYFYASCNINGTGKSISTDISKRNSVFKITNYKKGKVGAIADSEFFFNGNENFGIKHGNNLEYFLYVISLFINPEPKPNFENINNTFENTNNSNIINIGYYTDSYTMPTDKLPGNLNKFISWIEDQGYRIIYGGLNDSEFKKCNTWIIALPLKPLPKNFNILSQDKNVLLIGDSYTKLNLLSNNGVLLLNSGFNETGTYPLNRIATSRGIIFEPLTLMDLINSTNDNPYHIKTFTVLIRCGAIKAIFKPQDSIQFSKSTFFNPVSHGLDERVPFTKNINTKGYYYKDEKAGNCAFHPEIEKIQKTAYENHTIPKKDSIFFMVKTNDTLAFSDSEWLSNERFDSKKNKVLLKYIKDFLKNN